MSVRSEVIRIFNELIGQAKKIGDLPAAASVSGADLVEVSQGGTSKKATISQVATGGAVPNLDEVMEEGSTSVVDSAITMEFNDGASTSSGIILSSVEASLSWDDATDNAGITLNSSGVNIASSKGVAFDGSFGTAGQVLQSNGASAPPTYVDKIPKVVQVAASDETTALTTGTAKITFRMPYAMTVTAVRASLTTAQTSGSILTVDINDGGTTILSTKLTIDNGERTSVTAATPPVISDTTLTDDAEITIDIDQIGDGTAKGLKVTLIGS